MLAFLSEFLKGFWNWIQLFSWWQGLLIISVCLIIVSVGKYWRNIFARFATFGVDNETLQYRMFWGMLNNALNIIVKNEIRKSFKENGFDHLSGNDFSNYVKDKSKTLQAMLKQYIMDLYPPESSRLKVSLDDVLDYLNQRNLVFESLIFEIFAEAKKFKRYEIDFFERVDISFSEEVEKFIRKKNDIDCKNCLLILFGKREIAENKKRNVKTLKSQMNFVEQKLIEINSDIMNFYSQKMGEDK
jgi:hypothetical protein